MDAYTMGQVIWKQGLTNVCRDDKVKRNREIQQKGTGVLQKRNINLRVVREGADKPAENTDRKMQKETLVSFGAKKIKSRKKVFVLATVVLIAAVAAVLVMCLRTYTGVRVTDSYKIESAADNNYEEFGSGVLKYSRDGISYLNLKGEEQWNQPYQMKSPFLDVSEEAAAVADKGGNDIMVFDREGLKGEIETTLPIEKITVSEQGIVGVILKNESSPQIVCYDTAGNVLVEHKASMTGTGYPLDIALSPDGTLMQVVYLAVNDGEMVSRVNYYNFGKAGEERADHQVAGKEYKDSVLASGFFLGDSVSAVVADDGFTLFTGGDIPKEKVSVSVDGEIQSVFHNSKYLGMTLKKEGTGGYELKLFNTSGKEVLSEAFDGTYASAKISGSQVIMYDGKKCSIFTRNGIHKLEGEMENNILEIFPVNGINKYIVMNANGMESVCLAK